MKERFETKDPRSMMLRFHSQTAGSTLTAQQLDNNIVRVTIQALAAVLGGTQSLHTNSRDEALSLPTEESVRIALRTQQIIAHESGVTNTIDPLAGSYFVEALTNQIENEAEEYIKKIDAIGGMVSAIESGYVQTEIQNSAYKFEKELEAGNKIVVGVNKFQVKEETQKEFLKINMNVQEEQIKFLHKVKAERSNLEVESKLKELENAAIGSQNLMPFILSAVKNYASVGEICNTLRRVFGEYKEHVVI
jgi:methylmalonyl-CoA mutase N-terminal domain/subunit